ncbi:MAG: DUF1080 domain-containing protein [Planctomycetes bacterium]|nr:DUF1080 domain-containing protein [Planctomycetota bacterium]MCP4772035.1 DUF1080 domain-containing protein [Planctomycetota bacterium]MCP4860295.1 DUF1080 domain-containing protein [Planctomycetota bacterium]
MKLIALLAAPALCLSIPLLASDGLGDQDPAKQKPGYDDTPMLPGQPWRVHDRNRPQPPKVKAPSKYGGAPSDALVLFDGTDLSQWRNGKGEAAQWTVADGTMTVNATGSIRTKEVFGDCQLHVEWATPEAASGNSQGMGNSGVFLMDLYEIQVLDSHDNVSYADGSAGSIYGQCPPDANASRAPGEWQTYDIAFTAPRYEDGKEVNPARVTVFHNGVLVHNNRVILGPTTHRNLPPVGDYSAKRPIQLQDHGNPVRYRNIWVRSSN